MTGMRTLGLLTLQLVVLSIAACGTRGPAAIPSTGAIIPNTTVQIGPTIGYTVEAIAVGAAAGALLYYIYDPLAPNWSIEEKMLNDDTYFLSLQAKSFRTGGDGEAMQILKRRALQLQRERGFSSYRILDYSEGIESSTPLTRRVSEGTIQLVKIQTPARR
jgi:hypothetical protein